MASGPFKFAGLPAHNAAVCPREMADSRAAGFARQVLDVHAAQTKEENCQDLIDYTQMSLAQLPTATSLVQTAALPDGSTTTFHSALEAQKYREMLLEDKTTVDNTIPVTQVEKQLHVRALYMAFKSCPPECEDSDLVKKPFQNHEHDNNMVELMCWEMLDDIILRSKKAQNLVEAYEPLKYKFKKGKDLNFTQRFDRIIEVLGTSKSICKHVFDVKYSKKVVDDPESNLNRVNANRTLNGQKAEIMKRGKADMEEDESPRPKKKARKAKTRVEPVDEDEDAPAEEDFDLVAPASAPQVRRRVPLPPGTPSLASTRPYQSMVTPQATIPARPYRSVPTTAMTFPTIPTSPHMGMNTNMNMNVAMPPLSNHGFPSSVCSSVGRTMAGSPWYNNNYITTPPNNISLLHQNPYKSMMTTPTPMPTTYNGYNQDPTGITGYAISYNDTMEDTMDEDAEAEIDE
jgi:hypothetical protein